jgi:3-deoxy-D-manno-octulosonate 8-phosphate phosphatase KdsC-like HAD superfamily phosphatase
VPKRLHNLIIDVDGCLTNGKQYVDHSGEKLFKAFHSRDIRAIREFVSYGVYVLIYSADDFLGDRKWAERVGADYAGDIRDKASYLEEREFDPDHTMVVGDDAWDVEAMKWAKWSVCPYDADASVTQHVPGVNILNQTCGGQGVVAALLWRIINDGLQEMEYGG